MKSLVTLLKIRGAVLRIHDSGGFLHDKRVLDAFSASGYLSGGSEHEIVMFGGVNVRAKRPLEVRTLQEFADYREQGAVKTGFGFNVEEAGEGWPTIRTETRALALDDFTPPQHAPLLEIDCTRKRDAPASVARGHQEKSREHAQLTVVDAHQRSDSADAVGLPGACGSTSHNPFGFFQAGIAAARAGRPIRLNRS